MSYRSQEEYDPSAAKRSFWYWPALDNLEESYSVARGTWGGWAFSVMLCLGAIATYVSGKSAVDLKTRVDNPAFEVAGIMIELAFVLFASYRIRIGRAWIVSWLLLVLFGSEVVAKVLAGSFGWVILYVAAGLSILAGARACWDIRKRLKAGQTLHSTEGLEAVFE